jgi:phage terminase small subunit
VRAADQDSKLLRHPKIAPLVAEAKVKAKAATDAILDRYVVYEERIVEGLAKLAFSDAGSLFPWGKGGVTLRESSELTDAEAFSIAEVSQTFTADGKPVIKLKLADKPAVLVDLGRYKQLFVEKAEVTMKGDFASMLDAARKRSASGG